jgi:hypothetical protein
VYVVQHRDRHLAHKVPVTSLLADGGHPNRHAITVDGVDVHICVETVCAAR